MKREWDLLHTPGPTPTPPSVERSMSQPMIGHRGEKCKELMKEIAPRLKPVFGTSGDVLVMTGSGTSALEAAVVNTTKPGEEVIVVVAGAFGDRFAQICRTYELIVHQLDVPWGEAVTPDQVEAALQSYPKAKAVFLTHSETSTGVMHPVEKVAERVKSVSSALVIVDGVSSVGGAGLDMDRYGIDIVVSGSQKALMLPPGLAFAAVGEAAWKVIHENPRPRFYLDLRSYKKQLDAGQTPFTPALSLLYGLEQVLNLLEEEGLENVYARHTLMKDMTRNACLALGLPLLVSEAEASTTVTSIRPDTFEAEQLRKLANEEFGLIMAGGQKHMKGEIFRIGHMGYCRPANVLQYIGIIEIVLKRLGHEFEPGAGVAAAQEAYLKHTREDHHVPRINQ
ncbi:alanine--glyoxylate aminotransferase family protein [Halobacillus sp. ACCC02827]|uniref:pyridoxal-phosphate-dependent aminotransferase family protein n=1 Tax=Bacillaceae TaxID=186817 RepID=UPI0002A4F2C1|nr:MULTISPECIES: alanine--glyoxylate aminotransferase family protein [Bacillaceae]ELK46471.1 aminotransferase [Halobacillus sp. BAB-2008]QHT45018.1 alanine--glyoxylate aminotransferase family protein [Bacillus sp. SB49]WJE15792.1 alanine--glyoxylate aminotransferase family protein [Halobacillus sp. ACCC02827]